MYKNIKYLNIVHQKFKINISSYIFFFSDNKESIVHFSFINHNKYKANSIWSTNVVLPHSQLATPKPLANCQINLCLALAAMSRA
jgi:hypothetical protein